MSENPVVVFGSLKEALKDCSFRASAINFCLSDVRKLKAYLPALIAACAAAKRAIGTRNGLQET